LNIIWLAADIRVDNIMLVFQRENSGRQVVARLLAKNEL
jgi:hypothetical protein